VRRYTVPIKDVKLDKAQSQLSSDGVLCVCEKI
jgi:hypothetical protein